MSPLLDLDAVRLIIKDRGTDSACRCHVHVSVKIMSVKIVKKDRKEVLEIQVVDKDLGHVVVLEAL